MCSRHVKVRENIDGVEARRIRAFRTGSRSRWTAIKRSKVSSTWTGQTVSVSSRTIVTQGEPPVPDEKDVRKEAAATRRREHISHFTTNLTLSLASLLPSCFCCAVVFQRVPNCVTDGDYLSLKSQLLQTERSFGAE